MVFVVVVVLIMNDVNLKKFEIFIKSFVYVYRYQ